MILGGRWLRLLRLSLRNLRGYKLRTSLTTLGIVFGVGSVIAVMAMGAGAERELLKEIGRLGIRNIILNSKKPPDRKKDQQTNQWAYDRYGLTFRDERQIRETVPALRQVLPVHKLPRTVWNGSRRIEAAVYAVRDRHMRIFGLDVVRGRNLTPLDGALLKRVCVVRAGLLKELGIYSDPLGRYLQVGDAYYRIVGLLKDEEFLGYARKALDIDTKRSEVYVPYETAFRRYGTRTVVSRQGSREATDVQLSQIVASVRDIDDVLVAARMLQRVLRKNHADKDYEMVVPLEILAQRRKTQQVFNIFLVAIASISLLVGGIGIANIMLATVTERTREIGVRRALGAKRRHIVAQFLTETTVISTLGGLIGMGAGFGFSRMLTIWTGWEADVTLFSLVLALSISMGTGIVSGIFPARRAAQLDPIAALRHE